MKTPTLEEVKERFKDAKTVMCLSQDSEQDISKPKGKGIHFDIECFWIEAERVTGKYTELWNKEKGYAKILTYKTPKFEITKDDEELWLPVHNYHGFYEVSNMGNVRSISRKVKHSKNPEFTRNVFGRVLEKTLNSDGRYKVRLSMFGIKKTHLVSHLVSEVFLEHLDRSDFICVDHIDEDKTNDKASNLQIITKQQNTKKSFDYKLDQFKKGDYWFHSTGDLVLISEVTKLHGGTIKCKHINNTEHFVFHGICVMNRKATTEEVQKALEKEAVKRGFKEGVCFINFNGVRQTVKGKPYLEHTGNLHVSTPEEEWYKSNCNSNPIIFKDGTWATVIQTITKQEAEEKLKCKIVD